MILLEHHKSAKREIINRFTQLADVAESVGMVTLARDIRTTRIPKLEAERFHLVVLGEFNHGKSTFVNALLGSEILPTGITPTTASINHVVWAANPTAKVMLLTGESQFLDTSQIKDWVTVAGGHADQVAFVEVGYPSDLLKNNVVLVDTPGVNDLNEQRAEVTYGYVPRADAVLFLLDAGQALKDSEQEFLRSRVLENAKDRLVFVLGKMDMLSADERTAVVDYVKQNIRCNCICPARVHTPFVDQFVARHYAGREKEVLQQLAEYQPMGRMGTPEEVAHLALYLCSDEASFVTGQAYPIDGGVLNQ